MRAFPPGERGEGRDGVTGVEGVEDGVETRFGEAGESASDSVRKVKTAAAPLPPPLECAPRPG